MQAPATGGSFLLCPCPAAPHFAARRLAAVAPAGRL